MHPILSDKKKLIIYIVAWGVIGILSGLFLSYITENSPLFSVVFTLPILLVYSQVNLSTWYLCKAFPIEKNSVWKILLVAAISVVAVSSLWTVFSWGWLYIVEQFFNTPFVGLSTTSFLLIIYGAGKQLFLITLALSYLYAAFEKSRDAERRAYELRLLAQSAELRALRMQIDPHFLFNSLNSISALTAHDTEAARRMTMTLADYFRKSLLFGSKETISLQEELSLLTHYLDIEKIRFGSRLGIQQNIDPLALACKIPPLLLQPLLENAIKHGIAHSVEGGTVLISAQKKNDRLFLSIENPIDEDRPKSKGTGLGQHIVRKRLQTAYGNNGDLRTFINEKFYQVVLFLSAKES